MKQYLELLQDTLDNGCRKGDRTGTGTISVFGRQVRYDLQKGFPLVTTKFVSLNKIKTELLWFLRGDTNIKFLKDNDCGIWDAWATENGDLGPIYGKQWRDWSAFSWASISSDPKEILYRKFSIDQIQEAEKLLREKPDSRRIIVSAWNPADLPNESFSPQENIHLGKMALAACHTLFQFYTRELTLEEMKQRLEKHLEKRVSSIDYRKTYEYYGLPTRVLSLQLYQRSADLFLGVPYNIASYALMTHLFARKLNMIPGEFIHTLGDAHIYENHIDQVKIQLQREPKPLPKIYVDDFDSFETLTHDHIHLTGYEHHPKLKGKVAV